MLISPAYAQTAGAADTASMLNMVFPFLLVGLVFYFLVFRPQSQRAKEHKATLDALRRGDRVVTAGGIIGLVTKVTPEDQEVTVEIAEGVRVKVVRSTIGSVISKTEPVAAKISDETETK